jgi:hypothetical protein
VFRTGTRLSTNKQKGVIDFIDYPFFTLRFREDYLVFLSMESLFFSSVLSVAFLVDFLVLPLALAFALVSSGFSADFSIALSLFFSVAGGVAGFAGVAGVAWAKLTVLNPRIVNATTSTLIAFIVSPPFAV